jgi:hypothetical protein
MPARHHRANQPRWTRWFFDPVPAIAPRSFPPQETRPARIAHVTAAYLLSETEASRKARLYLSVNRTAARRPPARCIPGTAKSRKNSSSEP